MTSPPRTAGWLGSAVAVAATLLVLGPTVLAGPWDGVFLHRDFVTVPEPVWGENTWSGAGGSRGAPLDAVVTVLSQALPSGVVGRLLLVAPLLLAGTGTAVLLRRHGTVATVAGAALTVLNPYVAERLLLGQAPTLLGYAAIPWLVLAVRSGRSLPVRTGLVALATLPAAVTPAGCVLAAVTVLATTVLLPRPGARSRWLPAVVLLAPVVLLSLPWVAAGGWTGAVGVGADAFAVRSDGTAGTLGSVLTLGGVWDPVAWPASRAEAWVVLVQVLLVLGALLSWWLGRRRRPAVAVAGTAYLAGVGAVFLLSGPLLQLWRILQEVPGVAVVQDLHLLLAWPALAVAVLVAVGVSAVVRPAGRVAGSAVAVVVAVCGLLTVPDLPARVAQDLAPVAMPAGWEAVVDTINEDSAAGEKVLILPWQPFRSTAWAGPTPFREPLPQALVPETIYARDLVVRREGTGRVVAGQQDPDFGRALAERADLDPEALRELGVRWLVVWTSSPGAVPDPTSSAMAAMRLVVDGPHWQLWDTTASG